MPDRLFADWHWQNPLRKFDGSDYIDLVISIIIQVGMASIGAALALRVYVFRVAPEGCNPMLRPVMLSDYCLRYLREFNQGMRVTFYGGAASLFLAAVLQWRWAN